MDWFSDYPGSYALRLLVAAFAGGLIGIEREVKGKPAGLRTNILMCLGSCLIMILSIETAKGAGFPADPGRIAAQVVTGVGFIGAGMILRQRTSVTGLTSAATIWFVAALGLVIGSGDYIVAATSAVLTILTLTALLRVERRFEVHRQLHILRLHMEGRRTTEIRHLMERHRVTPENVEVKHLKTGHRIEIQYIALDRKHRKFVAALDELDGVTIDFEY